jgi:hypothetical protein
MIYCYGCDNPMHHAFQVHRKDGQTYPYCVVCEVVRRIKRVSPAEHERGSISNGTPTMRRRGSE